MGKIVGYVHPFSPETPANLDAVQHFLGEYKTQKNSVVEINRRTGKERVVLKISDPGPITQAALGTCRKEKYRGKKSFK